MRPPRLLAALASTAVLASAVLGAAARAEPLTLPSAAPPELVALTQKMEALQITSERISVQAFIVPHATGKEAQNLDRFLSLFDISVAGEEGGSPPVASLVVDLFGAHLHIRVVGGSWYVYLGPKLARIDGGRPWVDLGSAGLSALLTVNGKHPRSEPAPAPRPESFAALARLLRSPESVTPLGAGTVDGQAVVGFRETVDPSLLSESEAGNEPAAVLARKSPPAPHVPSVPPVRPPAPPVAPPATVEAFIAPDGQPVHVRFDSGEEDADALLKFDVFAINFPIVVRAPPARQTLRRAAFMRLEHRESTHRQRRAVRRRQVVAVPSE